MTDDQLRRTLQSVGMTAFVTHLELFESPLSQADVAAELQQREGRTTKSCRTRTSHARRILTDNRRRDALLLICSSRLPDALRDIARAAL